MANEGPHYQGRIEADAEALNDPTATFAYAHARIVGVSTFQSPQDFYREATQREDIRRILTELAK